MNFNQAAVTRRANTLRVTEVGRYTPVTSNTRSNVLHENMSH